MNTAATRRRSSRLDSGAAALWASAFVIMALILTQAARLGGAPALAGEYAEVGQFKVLTGAAGSNEEFIAVLNTTDETISVYMVENGRSLELYQAQPLRDLFIVLGRGPAQRR